MPERPKAYAHNIRASRRLRREATASEVLLWNELRDSKLDGSKFRRQHAIGRFVVDFYCDDSRLAIEIDGGIHLDSDQRSKDRDRQHELESRDIHFLRVTADAVENRISEVLHQIRNEIHQRGSYAARRALAPPRPQRRERGLGGEG